MKIYRVSYKDGWGERVRVHFASHQAALKFSRGITETHGEIRRRQLALYEEEGHFGGVLTPEPHCEIDSLDVEPRRSDIIRLLDSYGGFM